MPQPISIGTYTIPNLLYSRLNHEVELLKKEGFPLIIDIDKIGEFTFLGFNLQDQANNQEEEAVQTMKCYLADCLAGIIVDEWEARILRKIIRENFYYYNEEEKRTILAKAREMLNPPGPDGYLLKERKEKVMLKIIEYLELHKEIILEGFINFRLKEYQDELEGIVNSAVDEFLLEKEYLEFIRLLKYFVDIQEPKISKIKIIFKKNGNFTLLDEYDKPVQHECLDGLMVDLLEKEINYEDLLISALITLAPKEVEIHSEKEAQTGETIRTIQNVFGKRVIYCQGCEKCQTQHQK